MQNAICKYFFCISLSVFYCFNWFLFLCFVEEFFSEVYK